MAGGILCRGSFEQPDGMSRRQFAGLATATATGAALTTTGVSASHAAIATVIGHELTHVLAQHSNERLSRDQLTGIGLAVADAAIGSSDSLGGAATMAALGLGVQVGIALPYGRTQESEADRLGLELMARAGEIGRIIAREEGKPLAEGKGETYRAGQFFTYYAAECLRNQFGITGRVGIPASG